MAEEIIIEKEKADGLIDEKAKIDPAVLEEIVKAGVLYGRKKTKTNPRMRAFIYTTRNGIEIIDVIETLELIEKAASFLKEAVKRGGLLLFVGATPAAKELTAQVGKKLGYPYITERWLGGTLTNFKTIHQRLEYYLKLKSDLESGKLDKYTKKERVKFSKEIDRLTKLFSGLENLKALPSALLVIGSSSHLTAVREARRMKIPIVGLISTDADPDLIDYPVPGNDRARSSIAWVLEKFKQAIEEAKRPSPESLSNENKS